MVRRPHWSYSALSQYLRCPLQFYFERVAKLPKPFVASGLVLGRSVHAGLAEYHTQLWTGAEIDERAVRAAFRRSWEGQEGQRHIHYRSDETRDALLEQGLGLLDLYLQNPPPKNIFGVERELVVPLYTSDGRLLEKPLVAVVDLLLADERGPEIVEFKTSGKRYGDNGTDRALQARCYRHAATEYFGRQPQFRYVVLVKTKTPSIQEIDSDPLPNESGRLGDLVEAVEHAVASEHFYPVESAMNCSGCPFYEPCRDWAGRRRTTRTADGSSRWELAVS